MIVYHEVNPSSLESVLREGLKRTSRGEKGDDSSIAETDKYIDEHRPQKWTDAGVSRDDNLYGYLTDGTNIINDLSGRTIPVDQFVNQSNMAVLRLTVDPNRCVISELAAYNDLQEAIERRAADDELQKLAAVYWDRVIPAAEFHVSDTERPELMITYDIAPDCIEVVRR